MDISPIAQWALNGTTLRRFGDLVTDALFDPRFLEFKFSVAYMRRSGLDRLMPGIEALLNRGGLVSGAVGVDDAITSADALDELIQVSGSSTVISYGGAPIAHPKVYLFSGPEDGRVLVGSANLTRDGLYRNIEYGVDATFELGDQVDRAVFARFVADVDSLLALGENSPKLDAALLLSLQDAGTIVREDQARDPGRAPRRVVLRPLVIGGHVFPPASLPPPPPLIRRTSAARVAARAPIADAAAASIFTMQLSAFDSSHRTGVPGTAEILIPNDAMGFFPPTGQHGRRYADTRVRVVLNHPDGPELHDYRLWIYPQRTENRLRMDHRTLDLTTLAGGDIFIVSRAATPDSDYEVSIVKPRTALFGYYSALCTRTSNGKHWGLV